MRCAWSIGRDKPPQAHTVLNYAEVAYILANNCMPHEQHESLSIAVYWCRGMTNAALIAESKLKETLQWMALKTMVKNQKTKTGSYQSTIIGNVSCKWHRHSLGSQSLQFYHPPVIVKSSLAKMQQSINNLRALSGRMDGCCFCWMARMKKTSFAD